MESQRRFEPVYSCELFPPKTDDGMAKLQAAVAELQTARPRFFSVTYGAGGSTRDRSYATLAPRSQGIDAAPHLSCIGPRGRRPWRSCRASRRPGSAGGSRCEL